MSLVHHFFHVKGGVTAVSGSASGVATEATFHVAVQGCCHGELDRVYDACAAHEKATGRRIDLLVCCGDFQAVRGEADLRSMAVPDKYRVLGDFAAYYRREKHAPYLTLFVGGNHEASDWLAAECYGGFLAPNIYYMGHSGVVIVDERVTVAGLSGIFKAHDYTEPYPRRPFHASEAAKRSAYHVRRIEVEKLRAMSRALERMRQQPRSPTASATAPGAPPSRCSAAFPHIDLFLSHDWPVGITKYGDEARLLRHKPFFEDDIRHNALGNRHTMELLRVARPRYWLAAHLHCQFEATVPHHDVDSADAAAAGVPRGTKFVALDKCSKGKGFLDFVDIPVIGGGGSAAEKLGGRGGDGQGRLVHHPLWLEVLRETHGFLATNDDGWSAESCGLLRLPRDQLQRTGAWLPASSTASVLETLALSPAPLQQPSSGERGDAKTTATVAASTAGENPEGDLGFVEDTSGVP